MIRLLPIDAETYEPSSYRSGDRVWTETNCYVDLWIEVLHALGLDYRPRWRSRSPSTSRAINGSSSSSHPRICGRSTGSTSPR